MRKAFFILLIPLLLFAAAWPAAGQPSQQVTRLDMQAGLSDNCVNDVLVDAHHFLWVGTNAGLDLYDGSNIVQVAFPDTGTATAPVVFALAEDASGIIWAGTSEGLYHLDRDRLEMQHFDSPELGKMPIRQMGYSRSGTLWIYIKGRNLLRLDTASGLLQAVPLVAESICCSQDGALYAITKDGELFASEDGLSEPVRISEAGGRVIQGSDVYRASVAGTHLLLSVENDSAFAWDLESLELEPLPLMNRMRAAIRHSSGELWVAAREGIHVLDGNLVLQRVIRPFHDNSFRCLTEDADGRVWAGTLFEGLAQIAPDGVAFRHWSDAFAGGRFKARDFAETPDGRIWIGTDTRGLLCLEGGADAQRASRRFFPGRNVTGLMAEGNKLWVGTIDDEIPVTLLDTETGRMTSFPGAGKSAYSFCRDASGRLWIGGKDGFIAGRERPDGHFTREIFMPASQVCSIVSAADGSVWVASIGGSIYRYAGNVLSTYTIPIANILTDLAEDGEGRIFVTSEGNGLWMFNPGQNVFQPVEGAEMRLLKMTGATDGRLLWITGAHGIHVLNPGDGRQLPLIPREALDVDSFNYSSHFMASDGTLYAGTSDGFISLSARRLSEDASAGNAPVVSFIHLLSSSEGGDGDVFFCPASLNIGPKTRSFQVDASTLDYGRFPSRQLFWKIDGLNEWAPVQDGRFTVYDIPTGRWELKVKSLSLSGVESPETAVALRVLPPALLRPAAILLYLVFLLLLVVGIAIFSDRHAKKKAEREHERKLLESKMDFLASIAHEIRTPLSLVQIPLEALIRKFSSSPDGSVQENLDIMRRNSLKLTVLINELLDFRKLTDATFQIRPEFLDIRSVLKDAHRRFLPMFLQEGKSLSLKMPEEPVYCSTDVRCLGRIFDNLLSNALKYSLHYTSIGLDVNGQEAKVSVENDGAVLPEDVRELVFKPFYRYEDSAQANVEGTGLGLSTSRQFASLLGGSLTMDDDLQLNRFIFTIPVSQKEESAPVLPVVGKNDKSVMVVEDDKDMARVIGDILGESYNIIYASNGKEAMEKIEAGASPTLVVSDVIMPEMDGIALTKALKGNLATSHIPLILLSAEVPDVFMQESLEGGADAYLEKPFSPKKLRSTVDNLIENRRRVYEFYISSLPSSGELPSGRVSAMEQKFLRSIQEYVSANLHRNITLEDLSEVVCLSPSTLYKKMKEYADISPMEYVMKMRLHKAVELLKDDSVSVQEVASAVGFNTHSFFSECFKREFGLTPRQWRERNVSRSKK